jgi:hypothetical protein
MRIVGALLSVEVDRLVSGIIRLRVGGLPLLLKALLSRT